MRSIRAHLVLWLSAGLLAGIAVVLAATYSFAHRQIDEIFDLELRQIAQAVHLREDWLDTGNVRIAQEDVAFAVRAYDDGGRLYFESGLPALPPEAPQTLDPGYSVVDSATGPWRIYTHVMPQGVVQVAQPVAAREALARELSLRMLIPLLLLVPLCGALVAWVLKRGLAPLDATSRWVRSRDAARLDPLPTASVPRELEPLIGQINALLGRLAESLETQRRLVADAAHELRSPVAALALQAELARGARTDAARAAAFEQLGQGIERSRRLVQQLLDLARLEPGSHAERPAPLDLARLAREVVGSHAAQAEALGIDLGADAPPEAPLVGARAELWSMIDNLVDNALRYAPRGSAVTVTVRRAGDAIHLFVDDEGPGIPPAERERAMQRFQRVGGDAAGGSGLGLAIARAIAERHEGALTLEDARPGATPPGLRAYARLPGAPRVAPTASNPAPAILKEDLSAK